MVSFYSQGPRYVVQIGDKTIDYNEEFKLFMTTRNPAPEIPPDGLAVITEVNFTTTRAGLTGQVGAPRSPQYALPELDLCLLQTAQSGGGYFSTPCRYP